MELVGLEEGDRLLGALPPQPFADALRCGNQVIKGSLTIEGDEQIQAFRFGT